jgi:hypothetical protein
MQRLRPLDRKFTLIGNKRSLGCPDVGAVEAELDDNRDVSSIPNESQALPSALCPKTGRKSTRW